MPGGLPEPNPAAAAAATAALYGGAYPPGYLPLGAGEAVMNPMVSRNCLPSSLNGSGDFNPATDVFIQLGFIEFKRFLSDY
jgi:hypothetical protein